ncbi:hypothetical protein N7495_005655 [Penicillium taxi]|uniref:uncharacterized protein n=1 Tax=Penicillium taxi TaxID=168475 RepID=UPI002544E8C7|nr:uncharacterized protein N7495_005655 [Penicillium taxi]KAJ5893964.1 hypothetical protein N7495_005655 [Penicillium taxi]
MKLAMKFAAADSGVAQCLHYTQSDTCISAASSKCDNGYIEWRPNSELVRFPQSISKVMKMISKFWQTCFLHWGSHLLSTLISLDPIRELSMPLIDSYIRTDHDTYFPVFSATSSVG